MRVRRCIRSIGTLRRSPLQRRPYTEAYGWATVPAAYRIAGHALAIRSLAAQVWRPTEENTIIFNLPATVEMSTPNMCVDPPHRSVYSRTSVERCAAQRTLLQCCISVARLDVACHLLHGMRHGPWRGSYADMIEWMHTHLKDRSKIVLSCAAPCLSPLKAVQLRLSAQ